MTESSARRSVPVRRSAAADRAAAARDRRRLAWLCVGGLVVLLALIAGARELSQWRADEHARAQRDAVRAAAPSILADVFSYSPTTLAADNARARSRVTARFADANAAALRTQRAGAVRWRTRTVGIEDSGVDWAQLMAVATITDPDDPTVVDDRVLSVRLVLRDGKWLLDDAKLVR